MYVPPHLRTQKPSNQMPPVAPIPNRDRIPRSQLPSTQMPPRDRIPAYRSQLPSAQMPPRDSIPLYRSQLYSTQMTPKVNCTFKSPIEDVIVQVKPVELKGAWVKGVTQIHNVPVPIPKPVKPVAPPPPPVVYVETEVDEEKENELDKQYEEEYNERILELEWREEMRDRWSDMEWKLEKQYPEYFYQFFRLFKPRWFQSNYNSPFDPELAHTYDLEGFLEDAEDYFNGMDEFGI